MVELVCFFLGGGVCEGSDPISLVYSEGHLVFLLTGADLKMNQDYLKTMSLPPPNSGLCVKL